MFFFRLNTALASDAFRILLICLIVVAVLLAFWFFFWSED